MNFKAMMILIKIDEFFLNSDIDVEEHIACGWNVGTLEILCDLTNSDSYSFDTKDNK